LAAQQASSRLAVEGAWCAVLRVPARGCDEELAIALLKEQGVYVHPGHFYDFPSEQFLVLSLLVPQEQIRQGVSKILASFL
jgi:aspartate/methionine/tyrosine aminotransferase